MPPAEDAAEVDALARCMRAGAFTQATTAVGPDAVGVAQEEALAIIPIPVLAAAVKRCFYLHEPLVSRDLYKQLVFAAAGTSHSI